MLFSLLVQTFFYFIERPAASRVFQAIERRIGIFDLVQMRNERLADIKAFRAARQLGQFGES